METKRFIALVTVGVLQLSAGQLHAEGNRVTFPDDLEKLVHYVTVRRGNATENISTTS